MTLLKELLGEKWTHEYKVPEEKKGMFKGKTKAELESELAALKKSGPHKEGSAEYTKEKELVFALRAKKDWPKGESVEENKESEQLDEASNKEAIYYRMVRKALHPVLSKLSDDIGDDVAKEVLTKALREFMQEELTY